MRVKARRPRCWVEECDLWDISSWSKMLDAFQRTRAMSLILVISLEMKGG